MSYTSVFGGTVLYPAETSYLAIALTASVTLGWPLESAAPTYPAAATIDVTATVAACTITLPDATKTAAGRTILINSLSASTQSFNVLDNAGGAVATITTGTAWVLVLAGTATAAGTWRAFQLGASTATVQASALAGYGLMADSNQLSQSMNVTTFSASPRTLLTTDRAALMVWTGAGAATLNLPAAATAGTGFFFSARNAAGGNLTIDPSAAETVDGAATLVMAPGDSTMFATNGTTWYTVGLGQEAVFAFDYTSISLAGAAATYTLAGAELNRISYKFTGLLTNNVNVIVPPTTQQYWVENATTGAFTVTLSVSGGTPAAVTQGARDIYSCNGTNIVAATTGGVAVPISVPDGGTGLASYAIGDIIYASAATTLSKLADIATGNALISGGVGVAPSWGKIGISTHVSGLGTNVATALAVNVGSAGALVTFNGALGTPSSGVATNLTGLPLTTGVTGILPLANGGTAAALTDPNADRILFWDDSAGATTWLTAGSGLAITGTTLATTSSAWAELATQATTSGSSVSFTSISASYQDLLLVFEGVSPNGAADIRIELSDDNGTNWTGVAILMTAAAAADTYYGHITVFGYLKAAGVVGGSITSLTSDRTFGNISANPKVYRLAAGINAIRISLSAGAFDAGSIKLYGK